MRKVVSVLALAGLALAQDPREAALHDALIELRRAAPANRDEAVRKVLALEPERAEVLHKLHTGVVVPSVEAGWHVLEAIDDEGVSRPYQLFVPESLAMRDRPGPLLVYLHGGVNRPDFVRGEEEVGYGQLWIESAEREGFSIAFPAARQDCMWWTDAGTRHIRAVVRDVKRLVPVNDDQVFATGFSDGGSGCYFLAMAAPDPFAGFLPMNGHPAVASLSGHQLYLRNLKHAPMFAAMTQDDQLYPAAEVLEHLTLAMRAGAPIRIVSYEAGNHRPVYFEDQRLALEGFLHEVVRDPTPDELEWSCADVATGRVGWLEILEIGPGAGDAEPVADLNPIVQPGRPRLGFSADRAFEGEGVKVASVVDDSVAKGMGLAEGDVVVAIDADEVTGLQDLIEALGRKKYGEEVAVTVRRGEETRRLAGRFPEESAHPAYRREQPGAWLSLKREGNHVIVTSRNVRRFRLRATERLFEPGPIRVTVNGADVEAEVVEVPLPDLLRAYAREADGKALAGKYLIISTGPG